MDTFTVILTSISVSVLTTLGAIFVANIEHEKTRPKEIPHNCRVANLDVYTYFVGRKEHIGPSCVYLDETNFITCNYDPQIDPNNTNRELSQRMKTNNKNQCYLARFAYNIELKKRQQSKS
jgi:hypothetical protein